MHFARYHGYCIDSTMELSEATSYEVPSSNIYQDPGIDKEAIYQCFNTMRFQKLKSKDITYVRTFIISYVASYLNLYYCN